MNRQFSQTLFPQRIPGAPSKTEFGTVDDGDAEQKALDEVVDSGTEEKKHIEDADNEREE